MTPRDDEPTPGIEEQARAAIEQARDAPDDDRLAVLETLHGRLEDELARPDVEEPPPG